MAAARHWEGQMCHLRSRGRVAKLKNDACENGGSGFEYIGFVQHVADALLWSSGGVEGCDNVLDEYYTWPKLPVIGGCLVNFTSHRR